MVVLKLYPKISPGLISETNVEQDSVDMQLCDRRRKPGTAFVEELHALCMRRFFYMRCYDSFEFLATLKVKIFYIQASFSEVQNACTAAYC